jgi:hypothetical protein
VTDEAIEKVRRTIPAKKAKDWRALGWRLVKR